MLKLFILITWLFDNALLYKCVEKQDAGQTRDA